MNRKEIEEEILESHKNLMNAVEMDSPNIDLKVQIDKVDGKTVYFNILSTSSKLRVSRMVEEKVFLKGKKYELEGTIVDAYESTILAHFKKKFTFKEGETLVIKTKSNYNNEILLKAGENFFTSEKFLHPVINENYSSRIIKNHRIVNEDNSSTNQENNVNFVLFNNHLNKSQIQAVHMAINDTPFKILGPPGTGKTETIVEIISQVLNKRKTVLVCGPSNISIDNIISRFLNSDYNAINPTKFYRLGSSVKGLVHFNLEKMASDSVSFMEKEEDDPTFGKEIVQRKQDFIHNYKKDCCLVFATLFSSLKENFFFDLCIVDEACQGTILETFLGVIKAKNFILVGDPNQLCPSTSSLYEHLDISTVILNEQYRMPGDLLQFSNNYFYNKQIISNKIENFPFFSQSRILFIDTSYFDYIEEVKELSKMNTKEGYLVKNVVEWLTKDGCADIGSLGVIAPYSAQVYFLRGLVSCQVETVDGFQGQEKDFIILSLVRSNDDSEIGFLRDVKRLNVAITRARKGLVIIGDSQNFIHDKFFREFFKFLENNAQVLDPETFLMMTT